MNQNLSIQLSGSAGKLSNYCSALEQLGARPQGGYAPEPDLTCDGLVLCGGGDLDCRLFGQRDCGSDPPDPVRDRAELLLFDAFFRAKKPILGICRGMQLINVALGGTLIQDLPAQARPFHAGTDRDMIHPIRAAEGGFLHDLYGPVFPVNSWHHQAVDALGEGLRTCAWAESGFPEALEHGSLPILAVQFHPERMSFAHRRPDTVDGRPILAHFLALCQAVRAYL